TAQYSAPPRYSSPQYPSAAAPYPSGGQAPGAIAAAPPSASPPASPPASPSSAPIIAGEANSPPARRGDAFDPAHNPTAPGAPRPLGSSTDVNEPPPPVPSVPTPRQPGAPLDLSSLSAPATGSLTASAGRGAAAPPRGRPHRRSA